MQQVLIATNRLALAFAPRRWPSSYTIRGKCPPVNLPGKDAGRWGQGLTAEKMQECVWVRPRVVAEVHSLSRRGRYSIRLGVQ
jgi:hypothetical protein